MFTKLIHIIFLSLVAISISENANAEENQVEWRVLGPSFSHHSNAKHAPIVKAGKYDLRFDESGWIYFDEIEAPIRRWSQSNPSVGIEKSWQSDADPKTRDRIFASVLRDSHGKNGAMAGAGRAWQILQVESVRVEAGLTAGLWYRTIVKNKWNHSDLSQFKYRLVPFILPVLSINEQTTGIGVNISVAPKFIGKNFSIPTTTVMIQTSFLF